MSCRRMDVSVRGFVALVTTAVGWLFVTAAAAQVPSSVHYRYPAQTPPGRVGGDRLQQGGPVVGYFQPVAVSAPHEITVSAARDGGWTEPTDETLLAGMLIGQPYRLKLSNLPLFPGRECYPTVEIIDRTYPPGGMELKFPIPIVINDDDVRLAMEGMLVTRVVYVEDPGQALPGAQQPGEQLWHDVGPQANPLEVADQLGRPAAIIRFGGRTPDERQGPDMQFLYGCPPWRFIAVTPDAVAGLVPTPVKVGEVQSIGAPPAKPIAGQPLPVLPREAYAGAACPPPLPYSMPGPFTPPSIKGPYPPDEYLHDGGDALEPVAVSPEWRVQGLNLEDTVAHFDTQDGRTMVERTNCEYVYAPRFSSVRSVVSLVANETVSGPNHYAKPIRAGRLDDTTFARTNVEQQQPVGGRASVRLGVYQRELHDGQYSTNLPPSQARLALAPYEDLQVIRTGAMQSADKARLAESVDAAVAWTKDDGVQVLIDKTRAVEHTGDVRAQALFIVREPEYARLRICKLASTPAALPGEQVEFTLRYDNAGDQVLGNIVILDNLTTRLEYVEGTATSSRPARFSVQPNEGESLVLRWEIDEPLGPGDGGIVRFRCRVR